MFALRNVGFSPRLAVPLILTVLAATVAAQPAIEPADEAPERQRIEDLIHQIEALQKTEPLQAAQLFDTAWQLAVKGEDPFIEVKTRDLNPLNPGEHQIDAGSRARLQRVFTDAPAEFRKAYKEQVEADALKAFGTAARADERELDNVVLRYQFTETGQNALESLVRLKLSRGEFLQAALQFGRLMGLRDNNSAEARIQLALYWWNAELWEEAEAVVRDTVRDLPGNNINLNGIALTLPESPDDAHSWLTNLAVSHKGIANQIPQRDWSQPLGNYRRSMKQMRGPAMLQPVWNVSSFECAWNSDLDLLLKPVARQIQRDAGEQLRQNNAIAPAAMPLLVDDLVIFRGVANIRAVNRESGELVWESSFVDKHLKEALDAAYRDPENVSGNLESIRTVLNHTLLHHLVRANCSGQLTCAGQIVFAVEEATAETMNTDWDQQSPNSGPPVNYLRAHDLKTGQSLGFLGGPVGLSAKDLAPNPLKGFYILGAPLVMGERIYVMAERDQGIFLLQLDAGQLDQTEPPFSLRPVHSQLLSQPRYSLREHPVRKFSGVTPSFGRGLLICNTCDEKIVAVSAEDHAIRWVYRYPSNVAVPELGRGFAVVGNAVGNQASSQVDLATRWQDALPRIVNGCVVVTPRDSDVLICLDVQTGQQIWTRPRGHLRRIAHVDAQHVVLTGTDVVTCLDLQTGNLVWQTRLESGFICGSAASDGQVLHVPLSEPSIISLSLNDGRQLLAREISGDLPGNLVAAEGKLYSQSLTNVRCLREPDSTPAEPLELAANYLLSRKIPEAEEILTKLVADESLSGSATQRQARRLLIGSILESLRMDFEVNENRVPLVRQLIRDSSVSDEKIVAMTQTLLGMTPQDAAGFSDLWQRVNGSYRQQEQLQMLTARNQLRGKGKSAAELSELIVEMLDRAAKNKSGYGRVGALQLRLARATAGSIRAALSSQPSDIQQQVVSNINQTLIERMNTADGVKNKRWWIEMFVGSGVLQPAIAAVVSENSDPGPDTSALQQIIALAALDQAFDNVRSDLTMKLLENWKQSGNEQFADELIRRTLQTRTANEDRQLNIQPAASVARNLTAAAVPEVINEFQDLKTSESPGPFIGTPVVTVSPDRSVRPTSGLGNSSLRSVIPTYDSEGAFPRWSFVQKQGTDLVYAFDSAGRERWHFQPPVSFWGITGRANFQFNRVSESYAVAWGQFLALKIHHLIFVLDCSQADKQTRPRLLWTLDIFREFPGLSNAQQFVQAWQRTTQYSMQPTGLFPMSSLTPYGLAVYSGRRLILFDLMSGRREWQVDGLPDDCTMTVANDELLLLSEASGNVETRSIIDGTVTGSTPLPDWWTDASENSNSSIRDFEIEPGEQLRWRLAVQNGNCLQLRRNTESSFLELFSLKTGESLWSLPLPTDSVVSNIVDGCIAVLSDGRDLVIFNLITATRVADLEVPPAPNSRFLYLRPADDNWLILTDVFDPEPDDENPVGSTTVHINGPIYAVDRQSGELAWSHDVDHRWLRILDPAQSPFPANVPLLVLLKQPYRRDANGRIRGATVQAHILNTQTGDVLFDDEDLGYGLSYHRLTIDSQAHQIEVGFDRRSVLFDYRQEGDDTAKEPAGKSSD